jgi:NCAIR mutase (PurE)-related protein
VAASSSGTKRVAQIPELQVLETFANLDHDRSFRTGFPEAVFAEGKTAEQVAAILEAMAGKANERLAASPREEAGAGAILATR